MVLEDHYTGAEINATVNAGGRFSDAFPGETRGELDALRALFQRKALLARHGVTLARLAEDGAGLDAALVQLEAPEWVRRVDRDPLAHGEAGIVGIHDDSGEALLGVRQPREHHVEIRDPRVGDPGLATVEHQVGAVASRRGLHRRYVAAGSWLG